MPVPYVSLHNHTEFSLLDGACRIDQMVQKACRCGMPAVGISDHGNLFGVPKFVLTARRNGIRPVIGSEFYICEDRHDRTPRREGDEKGIFHQILFCKNETGYRNLCKLSSESFTTGYYYKPRIDRTLLAQHCEGLVATTCCLASEVNQLIMRGKEDEAEAVFRWYLEHFGSDYYVELQRHDLQDQERCNAVLLRWAAKYNVPVIATNDVHYLDEQDSQAHDLLLALQTGKDYEDTNRFRFKGDTGQLNRQFYFKTPEEMAALFHDVPHALENTVRLAESCQFELNLKSELFLPIYDVPEAFRGRADAMDAYLRQLTYERALQRYGEPLPERVPERIEHELNIIRKMGFAGYFLIVQEFTTEARNRGVLVGPGRGSAAGSVVAYCLGIIDIDPLAYDLLFERFLNPERVSPPDIDIDFDDEGRQAVIDFVVNKYGADRVSQIITYGTMGAKTAIRDVGRTLKVPLQEVNRIIKFIPDTPGMNFNKALDPKENPDSAALQEVLQSDDPLIRQMMEYARTLEGSVRQIGIHPAGVIIAPGPLSDYVPIAINNTRDNIVLTQYDGPHAEMAGLLKMDFLGLKTLSILKTACQLIEHGHGVKIDIDNVPLDDPKTYELYQAGDTVGTFQFESEGMRKYLRQLRPTNIEDLIAMNALYRPGPMDYIPDFIDRKQGRKPVEYPHQRLEPILHMTYGIMVYQEQIMQAAQILAGYSLGEADLLRRAMGKKKKDVMEKERAGFVARAVENGLTQEQAGDVFDIMEKFAGYGFNKSHAAAYSVLAFRTMYLKAHYPAEYMAAVLSHNLDNIEKITFFIEEANRMGIKVLPPSVNESELKFSVPKPQTIRFGLGAIKGFGESSALALIAERKAGGAFRSIFDLTARVGTRNLNKRALECLVYAGALDELELGTPNRAVYFYAENDNSNALDKAVQYAQRKKAEADSQQVSLFGGKDTSLELSEPPLPRSVEPWPQITQLNFEKDVIGFYLSGHPLDRYKLVIDKVSNCKSTTLESKRDQQVKLAGIVTQTRERIAKNGNPYGNFTLQDYEGSISFALFNEDYRKFQPFLTLNSLVLLVGQYRPRFHGSDYELRLTDVKLLETVFEQTAKEIVVKLELPEILDDTPNRLLKLVEPFCAERGCFLKFEVIDPETQRKVSLLSTHMRLRPELELLNTLSTEFCVGYN